MGVRVLGFRANAGVQGLQSGFRVVPLRSLLKLPFQVVWGHRACVRVVPLTVLNTWFLLGLTKGIKIRVALRVWDFGGFSD